MAVCFSLYREGFIFWVECLLVFHGGRGGRRGDGETGRRAKLTSFGTMVCFARCAKDILRCVFESCLYQKSCGVRVLG